MDSVEFGKYLKALREGNHLSIRKLSFLSGISISYISQLENGKRGIPKPCILKKLSSNLAVSYEELMAAAGYISGGPSVNGQKIPEGKNADSTAAIQGEDIYKNLYEIINFIENEEKLLLDGKPLDDPGRAVLKQAIEFGLSYVSKDAKQNKKA